MVRNEKYSVITQMPAKMQKLLNAGKVVKEPRKKESAPVTDVIVIDGPACASPILNLLLADRF